MKESNIGRIRSALFKGGLIGLFGLFTYWLHPTFLDNIDLTVQDVVHLKREVRDPDPRVVVVTIDETSVSALGRWPWSREIQAQLITAVKKAKAKVVGFDIVYSSAQSKSKDKVLSQAISAKGTKIVGGYFFRNQQSILQDPRSIEVFNRNNIKSVFHSDSQPQVEQTSYLETNIYAIQEAFDGLGFFNYVPDPDGLLRRIPLVWGFKNKYYPSLALKSLSVFLEQPIVLEIANSEVKSLRLGNRLIPTDTSGKMILNFYKDHQAIPMYSASEVIAGKHDNDLKDTIVFLGVSEVGIADVRPTPIHNSFPGIMAHGVASSNILQALYSIKNNTVILFDTIMMFLLPVTLILLLSFTRTLFYAILVFTILTIVVVSGYYWILVYTGWLASIVYPALILIISFIFHQIWFNVVSQKQVKFIKNAFSSYVASSVVDDIVKNEETLQLGGKLKNLTIFFSDIRDFTTLSERLDPEQLVLILNDYMDAMTEIVMAEKGTLDKYIGDAMMVLYNAPIDVERHQYQAALSAIKVLEKLPEVNESIKTIVEDVELKIGIGIHTGEVVVGNMGSTMRFDYTVIGDNVNLAARLEGATKLYGVEILISETCYLAIQDDFYCKELDSLQVKGKKVGIKVYQLMGLKIEKNQHYQAEIDTYERCLQLYYKQDFNKAIVGLQQFLEQFKNNKAAMNLIERCEMYLENPPKKDWNGVFVALSK